MNKYTASATVAMNQRVAAKKNAGIQVYNFAVGDPSLPVHPCILEAVSKKMIEARSSYPPVEGILELRKEASHWLNTSYATDYSEKEVLVSCGAKFALFALLQAYLQKGDEVLITSPFWVSYPGLAVLSQATPKILVSTEETGWKITEEMILTAATDKTKMLIFNNPCNPTGALYTKEEIECILQAAKKANLLVVADEVYSGLVYDGAFISCGAFTKHRDHVVVVQSCSKNFAMPGWRVGFLFAPEEIGKRVIPFFGQSITAAAECSQWAALGALRSSETVICYVRDAMKRRRDLFFSFIQKVEPPKAALYAFVPVGEDSSTFCEQLLETCSIAAVPGSAFGQEGYVRFAFSEPEEVLVEGLKRLKKWGKGL